MSNKAKQIAIAGERTHKSRGAKRRCTEARAHVMGAKFHVAEAIAILGERSSEATNLEETWKQLEQMARWLRV